MTSNCPTITASRVSPAKTSSQGAGMLGLPDAITACLFDMDGVITQTAKVHDAAWKEMFDDFLRDWSASHNQPFVPFDPARDYDEYVDGKPRLEGTASFLESRGIELPDGRGVGRRRDGHDLGPQQQEERPRADGDRARRGAALRGLRPLRQRGPRGRAAHGDRVVEREHRGGAQGGRRGEPVRGQGRPPGRRGRQAARQARAGHVPRGGAAARRRPRRTRPSTRTPWPGWPPGERGTSGSWWAWTGSARPTSCTRTAPTW